MPTRSDPLMTGIKGVHQAITRALTVLVEESRRMGALAKVDVKLAEGLRLYARTLCDLLHSHHDTEEAVGFARLRDGMATEALATMAKQHHAMLDSLHAVQTCVAAPMPWSHTHWRTLQGAAAALLAGWEVHRDDEERSMAIAAAKLTVAERAELAKELEKYEVANAGPGPRVLPFILYNLQGEDRDAVGALFPFYTKGFLVPYVWRGDYKAMEPFLFPR